MQKLARAFALGRLPQQDCVNLYAHKSKQKMSVHVVVVVVNWEAAKKAAIRQNGQNMHIAHMAKVKELSGSFIYMCCCQWCVQCVLAVCLIRAHFYTKAFHIWYGNSIFNLTNVSLDFHFFVIFFFFALVIVI